MAASLSDKSASDKSDESEPAFNYHRLGGTLSDLFATDLASAFAASDRFLVRTPLTEVECYGR
jgi:hypothetical protein